MTDKELRKLTRTELLELLLVQSKEIDKLNAELEQLQIKMQQREINLAHAGSIAEAAIKAGAELCMECGCCSYNCPANRPLVQTNKLAKVIIVLVIVAMLVPILSVVFSIF